MSALRWPVFTLGWLPVWRRNALVWRKLALPSVVGNFGDPFLYLLGIGYGLGTFVGDIGGMSYLMFFASGLVCSSAMNTATFEGLYSAYTRMTSQRTWEGILATPLRLEDVVLGEIIWAATKSLISGCAILLVAALLGGVHSWLALAAIPVIFLTGLTFGAMALFITAISPSYDFFLYYFTFAITPMFLFSGVFFPVESLPPAVAWIAAALPLTQAVDATRPLMTPLPTHGILTHLVMLTAYFLTFLLLTTWVLRRRLSR
jgi:lipooligosaccharide transport system permease protein